MLTSEVLDRAADIIEERGWAHGGTESHDPWGLESCDTPVCAEGGVLHALDLTGDLVPEVSRITLTVDSSAYQALQHYLYEQGELKYPDDAIFRWNDADGMNQDRVLTTLRGAASHERQKEQAHG